MNGSHVALGGGVTAMIAGVLMWVSHWPLQPLDNATAMDIAGLAVMLIGGGGMALFSPRSDAGSPPEMPPAPPPVPARPTPAPAAGPAPAAAPASSPTPALKP